MVCKSVTVMLTNISIFLRLTVVFQPDFLQTFSSHFQTMHPISTTLLMMMPSAILLWDGTIQIFRRKSSVDERAGTGIYQLIATVCTNMTSTRVSVPATPNSWGTFVWELIFLQFSLFL